MSKTSIEDPSPSSEGEAAPSLDMEALAARLLPGTQRAALACQPWVGRGDPKSADAAAVAAMREAFDHVPGTGTVVIGEGEKDDAPMLFIGEEVGTGEGPAFDLAIDPLENTSACARASAGALAVVAAAPAGALWGSPGWYMDKLVVGADAKGVIDITRPPLENLAAVAEALGKPVRQLRAVVLDKPRHRDLVADLHDAGVSVELIPDGDVAGALKAVLPDSRADVLLGVGGSPEGVITACAVRLLGGGMQVALAPQSEDERERVLDAGQEPGAPLTLDDLVATDRCCFLATGITGGELFAAPVLGSEGWRTSTFIASPLHPRQVVEAVHRVEELPESLLREDDDRA